MSLPPVLNFYASEPIQTEKLGLTLATHINPGDLILLNGPLGAGKSALARAFIRALLGSPELEVPSPTFLLALPYENTRYSVLHADLYRLKNEDELEELGLFEEPDSITLVEWPIRAPRLSAHAHLIIDIDFCADRAGRSINLSSPVTSKTYQTLCHDPLFF